MLIKLLTINICLCILLMANQCIFAQTVINIEKQKETKKTIKQKKRLIKTTKIEVVEADICGCTNFDLMPDTPILVKLSRVIKSPFKALQKVFKAK